MKTFTLILLSFLSMNLLVGQTALMKVQVLVANPSLYDSDKYFLQFELRYAHYGIKEQYPFTISKSKYKFVPSPTFVEYEVRFDLLEGSAIFSYGSLITNRKLLELKAELDLPDEFNFNLDLFCIDDEPCITLNVFLIDKETGTKDLSGKTIISSNTTRYFVKLFPVQHEEESFYIDPRDGKRYSTVDVGGLIMMGENMKYKIPGIKSTAPNQLRYYDNLPDYYISKNGDYFYNYAAIRMACPNEWLPMKTYDVVSIYLWYFHGCLSWDTVFVFSKYASYMKLNCHSFFSEDDSFFDDFNGRYLYDFDTQKFYKDSPGQAFFLAIDPSTL